MNKFKSLSFYTRGVIITIFLLLVLNIAARIPAFCDFYTDHFFWFASASYSRITGHTSISFGEPAIVLAALFVLASLVIAVILIFLRKKEKYRHFAVKWLKCFLAFLLLVLALMTLNCSIPYGCSKIDINDKKPEDYTFEQLLSLRNYLVKNCNELCEKVERDENGDAVFRAEDGQKVSKELIKELKKAMHGLSEEFPRLSGYCPRPKGLKASVIMYETGLIGIYFPFTMESNYSTYLAQVHFPATVCHEYSHLKGYMFEDEANFLAFLACMQSDNDFVRYSGFINALDYVEGDLFAAHSIKDAKLLLKYGLEVDDRVYDDMATYTEKAKEKADKAVSFVEEKTGISEQQMDKAGDKFTNAYADYYNVELNYGEVTYRLLQYYDGKLY
ncbi:MAG: DUF3810 domain-containing protein [Lachnospiraceae bacterium]|nr:DUF3810 domain-containing protein [Lachnospiraceae bacterium]